MKFRLGNKPSMTEWPFSRPPTQPKSLMQSTENQAREGHPAPKWAALVSDGLFPMPRQKLVARDILDQSGAGSDVVLVRDHGSPNDVVFRDEDIVDLALGNVFYVLPRCDVQPRPTCSSPAKLAFVINDAWEVTLIGEQTAESLRRLLGEPEESKLFRDYESPNDQTIGPGERIHFPQGPVFYSRKKSNSEIIIIVEGTPYEWKKPTISYAEVVTLFDAEYPIHPEVTYAVRYKNGPGQNPEGILAKGASVQVKNKMSFNVSQTGQS